MKQFTIDCDQFTLDEIATKAMENFGIKFKSYTCPLCKQEFNIACETDDSKPCTSLTCPNCGMKI